MFGSDPYAHSPYAVAPPDNAGALAPSFLLTMAQGDVTWRYTYRMTGQAMAAALGNETVRTTYSVLGQQINSAVGMVSTRSTYLVTGQQASFTQGDETVLFGAVIYPSGNVMTGYIGLYAPEVRYYLTGMQMTMLGGNELIWSPVDDSAPTIWVPVIVS